MIVDEKNLAELREPGRSGVVRAEQFIGSTLLNRVQNELHDPTRVAWRDSHDTYANKRGLTIVQNHDVYAHKLSHGDQTPLEHIPVIAGTARKVQRFVCWLAPVFPVLAEWEPNELSLHRYDDPDVGLSFHKDNLRFSGVVAILSLEGECDLAVVDDEREFTYPANPGDLFLLRATGLIDSEEDLRPEHAVVNLRTPTRSSLMLRQNDRPHERIPGFEFDNW